MGLVQIFLDKNDTTMKLCAFAMYPVHVVILNFMAEFRLFDGQ